MSLNAFITLGAFLLSVIIMLNGTMLSVFVQNAMTPGSVSTKLFFNQPNLIYLLFDAYLQQSFNILYYC